VPTLRAPLLFAVALLLVLPGLARADDSVAGKATPAARPVPPPPPPPPPPCAFAPVDLAIWTTIGLNSSVHPCARNLFGLGLGGTRAGELQGLQLALGLSVVDRDAYGVQIAGGISVAGKQAFVGQVSGLVSVIGENGRGLQVAGLVNATGGRLQGLQVAGLVNAAGVSMAGLQVGGLINAAGGDLHGIQVAGLINVAGEDMVGLQAAGLINAAGKNVRGLQAAGLVNAAGELHGIQIAGGMNALGQGGGLQIAGGYNRAEHWLDGVQIAVVNIGCEVTGAQIGVVNIAGRVHGVQLGLVNVATRADVPIGLVSFMREGERAIEAWGGEALPINAALRLGTPHVYSLLGFGSAFYRADEPIGPLAGVGVKGRVAARVELLVDVVAHELFFLGADNGQALLAQARARFAIDVLPRVAVTVGATWNVFVSDDVDGTDLPLGLDRVRTSGSTTVRQWPGFNLGVALGF